MMSLGRWGGTAVATASLLVVVFLLAARRWHLSGRSPADLPALDFSKANNVSGFPWPIVPNVVHFFKLANHTLSFTEMVNVASAWCHQRPERIVVHCDCDDLDGRYWPLVRNLSGVEVRRVKAPRAVFGRPFSTIYHAADVLRLLTLIEFGGIALDLDVYVVRSLDAFRRYEMALGWPLGANIGVQTLVAHRDARLLKPWLRSYKDYRAELWYYNAGVVPTEILKESPWLVHRVPELFGVHILVDELYRGAEWQTPWTAHYTIHLLTRHRDYLDKDSSVGDFDEHNIRDYRYVYGQMARRVVYGTTATVSPDTRLDWARMSSCRER